MGEVLIDLGSIEAARRAIAGQVVRTPLVRLDEPSAGRQIYLKLENLQPIRSFKLRGALNAIANAPAEELDRGVWTTSAGNMAQGVAWAARQRGINCAVVVPEHAPDAKTAAVERLGGRVVSVSIDRWWQAMQEGQFEGLDGFFVHPVQDEAVMAGNGTIGLEVVEDLPEVEAIMVPFGGGGLSCGISSAVRGLGTDAKVFAVEPATAAPLSASLAAGSPTEIIYQPSFVDGAGGPAVLPRMWPRLLRLIDGAVAVTLEETAAALRLLAERNSIVSEGAGALGVAAALQGSPPDAEQVVCIVSGGNIELSTLSKILAGETP